MNEYLKAGFSLLFFLLFGIPFLLLFVGVVIAYPVVLVPFVFFIGIGLLASNKQ